MIVMIANEYTENQLRIEQSMNNVQAIDTFGYGKAKAELSQSDPFKAKSKLYITVRLDKTWGRELFKPISKDAVFLCDLIQRRNFTKDQLKSFRDYGWDVEVKLEEYSLD